MFVPSGVSWSGLGAGRVAGPGPRPAHIQGLTAMPSYWKSGWWRRNHAGWTHHFSEPKTQGGHPAILFAVARTQAAGNIFSWFLCVAGILILRFPLAALRESTPCTRLSINRPDHSQHRSPPHHPLQLASDSNFHQALRSTPSGYRERVPNVHRVLLRFHRNSALPTFAEY